MRITVAGTGYVGMSLAVLLAQHNEVIAIDIVAEKIEMLNKKTLPIVDVNMQEFMEQNSLNLVATLDKQKAYNDADFIIVATPTDYDPETNSFNTEAVEMVVQEALAINSKATIIIKSTVPIGFTKKLSAKHNNNNIIFSPEFLREGMALHDNLYPSRIILGGKSDESKQFANLLTEGAIKKEIDVIYTGSDEAEAVKLFSNTYLAMRVSFFNELDTYAEVNNLDSKEIINAVCLDPRIGSYYNNPSFGYGGYCLPKDTKQLRANYKNVPNALIDAIVNANSIRKDFIADSIISKNPQVVGVHRLIMKSGSDNFRSSAIQGIIKRIQANDIEVVVYEPGLTKVKEVNFYNFKIIDSLAKFKKISSIIIANRMEDELEDVKTKVYTRDLFNSDE